MCLLEINYPGPLYTLSLTVDMAENFLHVEYVVCFKEYAVYPVTVIVVQWTAMRMEDILISI